MHLALKRQIEILERELNHYGDNPELEISFLRIVKGACADVENLKARVDEGNLRIKTVDRLGEILRIVAEEEAKLVR